jgi:hypothetical protein
MEARLTDGCPMFLYRGLIFLLFFVVCLQLYFTTVISLPERNTSHEPPCAFAYVLPA